jgi:hypothetical protein
MVHIEHWVSVMGGILQRTVSAMGGIQQRLTWGALPDVPRHTASTKLKYSSARKTPAFGWGCMSALK